MTVTFVNVSVDMILRFYSPLNAIEKFDTSGPDASAAEIAEADGWRLRHQNVRVVRDHLPFLQAGFTF